jgi:hypothetical protein
MDTATFDHSGHCPVSGRQKWDAVYQSECPADIIRIRRQGIASVGLGIGDRVELSPNQMGRRPQLFCDEKTHSGARELHLVGAGPATEIGI